MSLKLLDLDKFEFINKDVINSRKLNIPLISLSYIENDNTFIDMRAKSKVKAN